MKTGSRHLLGNDSVHEPVWIAWLTKPLQKRIRESPSLQRIIDNTSWLIVERLVDMTIRFFVGAWLVRYLGPGHFGVYSYALSFVVLFGAFSSLGLDNITVRDLSQGKQAAGPILATVFALRLAAAVVTIGLIAATIFSVEEDALTRVAILIAAGQLLFHPANIIDLWFQSQVRSKYVVWMRSLVTVLFSGSQVVFILAGLPLPAFLVLILIQAALTAVGLLVCFKIAGPGPLSWRPRLSIAGAMLRDAWPLIIAGVSVSVYMRIDQVMIGVMIDDAAVGIYSAAVKISELWYFLPVAIAGSVFPKIVQLREAADAATYKNRMQTLYDSMALFSYGVIILITFLSTPIIELLFGPEYAASAAILQVHIWALLFVSLGVARSKWLIAENLTVFSMVATVLGAVINVGLNLLLIPRYAGLGAAWATLVSYAAAAYLSCLLLKRVRPVFAQLTASLFAPFRLLFIRLKAS